VRTLFPSMQGPSAVSGRSENAKNPASRVRQGRSRSADGLRTRKNRVFSDCPLTALGPGALGKRTLTISTCVCLLKKMFRSLKSRVLRPSADRARPWCAREVDPHHFHMRLFKKCSGPYNRAFSDRPLTSLGPVALGKNGPSISTCVYLKNVPVPIPPCQNHSGIFIWSLLVQEVPDEVEPIEKTLYNIGYNMITSG
jgi:hypothetical protein